MFDCDLQPIQHLIEQTLSGQGDHPLASILRYHFTTGGKYLRARLALATSQVLQVPTEQAQRWAVACEMAHNATLIHDDVQDGDELRRDQPTVWRAYGVPQAINAGDLLLMLPTEVLAHPSISAGMLGPLLTVFHAGLRDVIVGQGLECAPLSMQAAQWPGYLRMVQGKTSALFTLPVAGIALLSGVPFAQLEKYTAPFVELGIIFQMQDDILDLLGKKGRASRGEDIREGKLSALVVAHLALHPNSQAWLFEVLQASRLGTSTQDVELVLHLFVEQGALLGVLRAIDAAIARACSILPSQMAPVWWYMLTNFVATIEEAYRLCHYQLPKQQSFSKATAAMLSV